MTQPTSSAPDHKAQRVSLRLVMVLAAVFLFTKLPFLYYSPYTFDEEEIKPGAIGAIILEGAPLPLSEYILGGYEGGALVMGLSSVPFQLVFGKTLFAYKVMAICVSLGILLLGIMLLSRIAGPRAGLFAGVLVISSPPYLTQFQFILWGNYMEVTFLTLLAMVLFTKMLLSEKTGLHVPFFIGLICGLGTFMHYGMAVTPIAIFLVWYFTDHRLPLRPAFWLMVLGLIAGFAPWLIYNIGSDFKGMVRLTDGAQPVGLTDRISGFFANLQSLFTRDLAMVWHFRPLGGLSAKLLSYGFYTFIMAGLAGTLFLLRKTIARGFAALLPLKRFDLEAVPQTAALLMPVYIAGYIAVFCASDYGLLRATWGNMDPETHAHIFVILYLLVFTIAFVASRIPGKLSLALLLPPVILGLVGSAALLDFSKSNAPLLKAGYQQYQDAIYSEVGKVYGQQGGDWQHIPGNMNIHNRLSFYYGLGVGYGYRTTDDIEKAVSLCKEIQVPENYALCVYGAGAGIFERYETGEQTRDEGLSKLEEEDRLMASGGAADILLTVGFVDHPVIEQARQYFFTEEFEQKYQGAELQHYMRNRLKNRQEMSVKQ